MNDEELLNCPFCGAHPTEEMGLVTCRNKGCGAFDIEFAPECWNRRHTPPVNEQQCRAEFEAWADTNWFYISLKEDALAIWKAAWNRRAAKRMTDDEIDSIFNSRLNYGAGRYEIARAIESAAMKGSE